MFKIAERIKSMSESATLRMAQMARQMASEGHEVINLSLGEPDFDTPQHIKEAAIEALRLGYTKYTPVAGTLTLRQAICKKLERDNQLNYSPDEIIVSNGAKQSFANLCFALLEPGDEVLLFAPYWVSYYEIVKLTGAQPIGIPSSVESEYKPLISDIRNAISPRTKMLVFSSPCNPTGTVFTKADLESYADLFRAYPDLLIVSDEIYEYIQFEGKHISIASFKDMKERCVTINGFSKGFSMTGWRLGYLAGPKQLVAACIKIQGQFTSGAASFSQHAAITALESDLGPTHAMCAAFKKRRDHLLQEMHKIPEWKVNRPQGAFYLLPNVQKSLGKSFGDVIISDSEDLALYLLKEAKVALVSGIAFGADDCLRISYSLSETKITEAVNRIRKALDKLT